MLDHALLSTKGTLINIFSKVEGNNVEIITHPVQDRNHIICGILFSCFIKYIFYQLTILLMYTFPSPQEASVDLISVLLTQEKQMHKTFSLGDEEADFTSCGFS